VTHPRTSWFPGIAAALSLAVVSASAAQPRPASTLTLQDVIQRAVAATASFEREFAAVVADEHIVQRATQIALVRSLSRREMRSDLLLVRLPGQDAWLPFRDVYEVDGRAVRDRTERLQKLFVDAPQTAVGAATQITNESSRYNIGRVIRTINVPTFGLLILKPEYLTRFEFRKRSEDKVRRFATWRITFEERERPTIVRTLPPGGDDVTLEGSLWIQPQTGRVLKTLVKTAGTPDPAAVTRTFAGGPGRTFMWVETTFAPNDALGLWVPERMTEWARAENRSEVSGTATYSRFRRFTVKTVESFQGADNRAR
jgi:hypothetical protein